MDDVREDDAVCQPDNQPPSDSSTARTADDTSALATTSPTDPPIPATGDDAVPEKAIEPAVAGLEPQAVAGNQASNPFFRYDVVATVTVGPTAINFRPEAFQVAALAAIPTVSGDYDYRVVDDQGVHDHGDHDGGAATPRTSGEQTGPESAGDEQAGNAGAGEPDRKPREEFPPSADDQSRSAGAQARQAFAGQRRQPRDRRTRDELLGGLEAQLPLVTLGITTPSELNAVRGTVETLLRHQTENKERNASTGGRPDLPQLLEILRQQPLLMHAIESWLTDDEHDFLLRHLVEL